MTCENSGELAARLIPRGGGRCPSAWTTWKAVDDDAEGYAYHNGLGESLGGH